MDNKIKDLLQFGQKILKDLEIRYGDIRFVHQNRQWVKSTNGDLESLSYIDDLGFGVRILEKNSWGFSASNILTYESVEKTIKEAFSISHSVGKFAKDEIKFPKRDAIIGDYSTPYQLDPFSVSDSDKISLVTSSSSKLKDGKNIHTGKCSIYFFKADKYFASSEGSLIYQSTLLSGGSMQAIGMQNGITQVRSYPASHEGRPRCGGYEIINELNLPNNTENVIHELNELLSAPPCPSGKQTVILTNDQMVLQLHESCGHPSELDRVLGDEISIAGGSFLTINRLGNIKYGSDIVNIYGDAKTDGGAGSFGFDDEGTPAKRFDIVKNGVFVGYLSGRESSARVDLESTGAMRAQSWNCTPVVRMTNVNLAPGNWKYDDLISDTQDGLLLCTNKSWSIDDLRLNFQFGCEMAQEIKNGKLGRIYRDPIYTGITPEFWNSCDAICDKDSWEMWGLISCGKGDPMQSMHVGHGVAPARFNNVQVGAKS